MRKPEEFCLLCQTNLATKTNSHILPRFISTDFLRTEGGTRRGYSLGGEKTIVIQDSAKENYILCDACEAYFSVIENLSADTFKKWQEKIASGEFQQQQIIDGFFVVICQNSNPKVIRLFVYSMFWRVSISSVAEFAEYKLKPEIEESLRSALLSCKSENKKEFLEKVASAHIPLYPYSMMTAPSFAEGTANVVAAINDSNPYSLNVDRFGFLLFEDIADIQIPQIRDATNTIEQDCMIQVISEDLWHSVMVKRPLEIIAKQKVLFDKK